MDKSAGGQLRVIREVIAVTQTAGIPAAMKEQFPHLRNGRPWRQKDIGDTEILRGLAAGSGPG